MHLAPGRYVVNVATKWALAGYWDQLGFEVTAGSTEATADYLMREAEFISNHDVKVATHLARILSGGDITPGTLLSEQHLLDLEREAFLSLCGEPKTLERIAFTLKTGKPLRN